MFGFRKTNKPDRRPREELLEKENGLLRQEIQKLQKETGILREELRRLESIIQEYRGMFFKSKALKAKKDDRDDNKHTPKKPGASIGHEGTTRQVPKKVDEHKDVHIDRCPECSSPDITPCARYSDHYQEDIVIPQTRVTRFRHHYYWCPHCEKAVHGTGADEIPGSYIGPNAKALAAFLHYQMSVPYRKVKTLFKEMFGMVFDPTSCVGFDTKIRVQGNSLYEKLKASLKDRPYLNVDETGWKDKWLWCYADRTHAVYRIEPGRGQKEIAGTLGIAIKESLYRTSWGRITRSAA